MKEYYNCDGLLIEPNNLLQVRDVAFYDDNGKLNWNKWIKYGDNNGFDTRIKNEAGQYIFRITLPAGKTIVRYGLEGGSFSTDKGTEYEALSLPYDKSTIPYHEYIVEKNCEVECIVDKGIVAPGFNYIGGGIQYRHYYTIRESIEMGIIKEDFKWKEI